ncbi:tyrosine-type recombinase/integrase [Paenibacillus wenxiniae]|uniref:Tyrosine-type recombinase/integrase n=1 Tax=Paenibacillus wenxiniae TaxID=1636843 RepID=A0ABW4RCG9_9BACL
MARAKRYPKVRELSNGRFTYRYSVINSETGKRKQKETRGFSTAKEAYQEGLRIEEEIARGIYIEESKLLVKDWADKWLEIYSSSGRVKPSSIHTRRSNLSVLKRKLGFLKLKDVTPMIYQDMLDDMKKEGKQKNTISNFHTTAKMMFKKAKQLELIAKNPTEDAEIPVYSKTVEELETEEEIPRFLEKNELATLLKVSQEHGDTQMYHALFVLSYTGLRVGEMLALKLSDIDRINKRIKVAKTLFERGGIKKFKLIPPKTKSSRRSVDLGSSVLKIISKQEAWRNEFIMFRRNEIHNVGDFLFLNQKTLPGYPLSEGDVLDFMKKMLKKSGLNESLTPHSLRHTYTSLMAEAGVELPAIQRLLGHSNDVITQTIYLHITKTKKKEAVDKLDSLMSGVF